MKRSGSKGWWAPDAKREIVRSLAEVSALLRRGCACRHVGETSKNALSSRSHAVFTLELALPPPSRGPSPEAGARGPTTLRPKVTFVDLAGSERTKDAGTSGVQQKEGTKINLSLFNLGSVINALGNKVRVRVRIGHEQFGLVLELGFGLDMSTRLFYPGVVLRNG